jgi:hypothetical protein
VPIGTRTSPSDRSFNEMHRLRESVRSSDCADEVHPACKRCVQMFGREHTSVGNGCAAEELEIKVQRIAARGASNADTSAANRFAGPGARARHGGSGDGERELRTRARKFIGVCQRRLKLHTFGGPALHTLA